MLVKLPGLMSQSVRGLTVTVDTTQRLLSLIGILRKKSTTSDSEKYSHYEYVVTVQYDTSKYTIYEYVNMTK
jgi:hypothetical protein